MNYRILTDSCCDFTDSQYRDMGAEYVPLSVMWEGTCHSHFSTEDALKEFYDGLRGGRIATTSALNVEDWTQAMVPALQSGQDLLVLSVSSAISATFQSAHIAARDLQEVYPDRCIRVVDSRSGSLGQGLLLWHACQMRRAGESLDAVAGWLEENCRRVCHWVTVSDLSHLRRSGRLSSAGAFLGNMLGIKPIIHVTEEGKLECNAKARGRSASIRMLAQKFARHRDPSSEALVTIAHGDCPEDAAALEAILREEYGVKNILTGYVGPILGAHTGPGVLGLFHLGQHR